MGGLDGDEGGDGAGESGDAPLLPACGGAGSTSAGRLAAEKDRRARAYLREAVAEAKETAAAAWPVALTTLLEIVPTQLALAFVGHMGGGRNQLDGAVLGTMAFNVIIISSALGLNSALDTLCAQAVGAGHPKRMGLYLQRCSVVVFVLLLPLFAVMARAEDLLLLLGQEREVARLAGQYVFAMLPSVLPLVLYDALRKPLQALDILYPMLYVSAAGNALLAVLCYAALGPLGYPFYAAGACLAIVQLLMFLSLLAYVRFSGAHAEFWGGFKWRKALRWARVKAFVRLAVPSALAVCGEWWAFEVLAVMAGLLPDPTTAIAANSVILQVCNIAFAAYFGISVACSVRVGARLGDDDARGAKLAARAAIGVAFLASLCVTGALLAARKRLAYIYTTDEDVVHAVDRAAYALAFYQVLDAVNTSSGGVFRGSGRQSITAVISFASMWLVGLTCAYLFGFRLKGGVTGMWWGMAVGVAVAATLSLVLTQTMDYGRCADKAAARVAADGVYAAMPHQPGTGTGINSPAAPSLPPRMQPKKGGAAPPRLAAGRKK